MLCGWKRTTNSIGDSDSDGDDGNGHDDDDGEYDDCGGGDDDATYPHSLEAPLLLDLRKAFEKRGWNQHKRKSYDKKQRTKTRTRSRTKIK